MLFFEERLNLFQHRFTMLKNKIANLQSTFKSYGTLGSFDISLLAAKILLDVLQDRIRGRMHKNCVLKHILKYIMCT